MVYSPPLALVCDTANPVAGLVAVTVAPGTTAPVGSVTVPVIEPFPASCALADRVAVKAKAQARRTAKGIPANRLMETLPLRKPETRVNMDFDIIWYLTFKMEIDF